MNGDPLVSMLARACGTSCVCVYVYKVCVSVCVFVWVCVHVRVSVGAYVGACRRCVRVCGGASRLVCICLCVCVYVQDSVRASARTHVRLGVVGICILAYAVVLT